MSSTRMDRQAGGVPSRGPEQESNGRGLASPGGQVITLIAVLLAMGTSFIGSGALGGTSIKGAAGGWLDADATWIAPAEPAFSLWSFIYTGLFVYGIWQFLPSAQSRRHDRLRPWILLTLVFNGAWIWVVQADWLGVSLVMMLLLLACLLRVLVLLESGPTRGWVEGLVLDGVQGLHLGWVMVAAVANVAAVLASVGWMGGPLLPSSWALVLIVAITVVAGVVAVYDGGRLAPTLAIAWGLAWIGRGRSDGEGLLSGTVALTAYGAAVVVVLCGLAAWLLSRRSATGEARDLVLDALDGGADPVDGRR